MANFTIEQKAKAYDEALEIANAAYKDEDRHLKATLERIFPELKESEDERIKKAIISGMTALKEQGKETFAAIHINDCIAWLEKQGELANFLSKGLDNAHKRIDELIQKNNELCIKLEKQSGQKTVGKIKPKFHEGEWITNGDYTWKIVEIKPLDYILQSQYGNIVDDNISYVDEQFHSFTIEDAKDGDVLAIEWNQNNDVWEKILIFKALNDIGVEGYGNTFKNKDLSFTDENVPYYSKTWTKTLHPATKEQCYLLFSKIIEAGYEWDAEKKELKKVDAELTDFEKSLKHIMIETLECGDTRNLKADAEMLLRFAQKPTEWSEDDEKLASRIEGWLDTLCDYLKDSSPEYVEDVKDVVEQLKSIKPQNKWKPSDEQIGVIEAIINNRSFQRRHLNSLYEQLKKLKGE